MASKVLIVDDDPALLRFLREYLAGEGFQASTAESGSKALKLFYQERPDLLILDVMMPGMDGWEVCARIRELADTPIIMLTALGGEGDRVAGLETGADDYLAKPFGMRELLARVRALLRRSGPRAQPDLGPTMILTGDLEIDRERREIRKAGVLTHLKPKEYELLLFFVQHPGRVFSREQILDEVWGYDFYGGPRTVDVHVRWLRQKVEDDPGQPTRIRTVRGSGYIFEG